MRVSVGLTIMAGCMLATGAIAQTTTTTAPPPPPPGAGMMRADANGDGTITRAEMIAEAEARFAAMDTDKDGKVTAAEREAARSAMRGQWRGGAGGRDGAGGMRGDPDRVLTREETVRRAGVRFDRLDANHDGKLDAAEIAAARPMRGPRGADAPPPPAQ